MRTISAAQQAVLDSGQQADWTRVSIKDAGGTYRDLTTWPGFNAVMHVDRGEDINAPDATASVGLKRELFKLSLSPFVGNSALNKGFDPAGAFGALIFVNRSLKIERAVMPFGRAPSSGDWFNVFEGTVMDFDVVGYGIQLNCRAAPSARLSQQYIKLERLYSYATVAGLTVPLRIWEANQVYAANEYILPASRGDADPGKDKFLKIVTGGTSGPTEPVWTTGAGQADGTCVLDYVGVPASGGYPVEQVMQNLLDDNKGIGDSAVTLYTPTTPSWAIYEFLQQRSFTLDALKTLANQIGWDVRPKWRSGTSQFELTLYAPSRASPTVVHTFAPADYEQLRQLAINILEIRNHWFVWYPDSADPWPDGIPKRKQVEVSDSASIAKYGDLIAEIQEDQTGLINTSGEANTLANNALSDCAEPTAAISAPLTRAFPWVELNDYYTFSANPAAGFDGDTSLAVTAFKETTEFGTDGRGSVKMTLTCRGKPTIGAAVHINKIEHPQQRAPKWPHRIVTYQGKKTPLVGYPPVVGGARAHIGVDVDKLALPEEYEHHVYKVSGTTLDSTTLKTISRDRSIEFSDLIGGGTYYHRVVPRAYNAGQLVRMQPSAEQSFVAGQAYAGHIKSDPDLTSLPLNGGFETSQNDPAVGPPDHWSVGVATWGTDMELLSDNGGRSGANYLHFKNTANGAMLISDPFLVRQGGLYRLDYLVKDATVGHAQAVVEVQWLDYQQLPTLGSSFSGGSGGVPLWALGWAAGQAPTDARWARIRLYQANPADANGFYVDRIQVREMHLSGFMQFGNGTLPSTNVTNYLQPGGTTGAVDATERAIGLAVPSEGAALLFGARYHARTAQSGMTYAFTLRQNGVDTGITFTATTGVADNGDASNFVFPIDHDTFSMKVVGTQTGGGAHTGAADGYVTVGIYV